MSGNNPDENLSANSSGSPNRVVGHYELLEEIGVGGMSRVYRARSLKNDEVVALKVIHVENIASDFEARLRREPEIQKGLGHENIVHLHESFRYGDEFFLAMEYIDGRALSQIIYQESGPLKLERARSYFRQTLRAVDHLHRLGIIHRDVKPSNILVRWDDVVKLSDFGIAKFAWQQAQTSTQRGLGTPEYMSPEQARGAQIDLRSDIYSLGISLYESLTGRRPFMREHQTPAAYMEVIQEILQKPLPDPRLYNPAIPEDVVRMLRRASAKDPEERFQSCAEFLGALEVVGGETSTQNFRGVSGGTYGAPTVIGGVAVQQPDAQQQPVQRVAPPAGDATVVGPPRRDRRQSAPVSEPRHEPRRSNALPWVLLVIVLLGIGGYFAWPVISDYIKRSNEPPPGAHISDTSAAQISRRIASEFQRYQTEGNAPAIASLYAPSGIRFFKLKNASRRAIESDLVGAQERIIETPRFDVEVRRARAVNDSTIETEWLVFYERVRDDSMRLRGSTSNNIVLKLVNGEWLITSQTEKWTRRDNVPPPKPEPDVVATDTVVPPANIPDNEPEVVDINPPKLSDADRRGVVDQFMQQVSQGNGSAALSKYASSAMSPTARERLLNLLSTGRWTAYGTSVSGDQVVASVTMQPDASSKPSRYSIVFSIVNEGGAKIRSVDIRQQP